MKYFQKNTDFIWWNEKLVLTLQSQTRRDCDCNFWSGARVAEEARLESVYTPKAYPEFESRS
ncbi:MAG: hypothetical protein K2K32_04045, partial [Muribaculaceae bacterium]|nr:hypothetical protein [Muribaculaceae bacterium]